MWFWQKNKDISIEQKLSIEDETTDEIELSLRHLKKEWDLPTEEIEIAINSRRDFKLKRIKSK